VLLKDYCYILLTLTELFFWYEQTQLDCNGLQGSALSEESSP